MLAETVFISPASIAVVAGIVAIFMAAIKFGDRLWKSPAVRKQEAQNAACRYDHQLILGEEQRMENALAHLADSQSAVLRAVEAIATGQKHDLELQKLRHQEVMKSLELIERRLTKGAST